MAYKTNYLEKTFKGKIYDSVEKAINAGATSYALDEYEKIQRGTNKWNSESEAKEQINILYAHFKDVIELSVRRTMTRNRLISYIEYDNSPVILGES